MERAGIDVGDICASVVDVMCCSGGVKHLESGICANYHAGWCVRCPDTRVANTELDLLRSIEDIEGVLCNWVCRNMSALHCTQDE